jgi:hypothetical protein
MSNQTPRSDENPGVAQVADQNQVPDDDIAEEMDALGDEVIVVDPVAGSG